MVTKKKTSKKKPTSRKTKENKEKIDLTDKKWKIIKNTISNMRVLGLDAAFDNTLLNNYDYEGDTHARNYLNSLIYLKNNPNGEILKQEDPENDDDGDDPRDAPPPWSFGEEIDPDDMCRDEFVTKRQVLGWYRRNHWAGPFAPCSNPRPKNLEDSVSIPIYYVLLSTNWTEGIAREKMDAAKTWFEKYCINLQIFQVSLPKRTKRRMISQLVQTNNQRRDLYTSQVHEIYKHIWSRYLGKPKKFLLIILVDNFNAAVYGHRTDNGAGNFVKDPVILIPHNPDMRSRHIVTHELLHGLGKKFLGGNPVKTRHWTHSIKNTWDEGGCQNEMGVPKRARRTAPLTNSDDDVMDWASYIEMAKYAKNIL